MIKVNDRFSVSRDGDGWKLIETREGTRTDPLLGEMPTKSTRNRYYPDLTQTINSIVDLSAGDVLPLPFDKFIDALAQLRGELLAAIDAAQEKEGEDHEQAI
jgi:hypothetical protein